MVVAYKKIMSNKRSIEGSLLVTFLPMCLPLVICFLFQVWMNTALELLDSTNGLHMMINTAPSLAEHLFVWYIAVLFNLLLPWNLQRIAVLVRFLQCPDNFFFAFAKPNVNQGSWNNVFSCPLYFLHTVLNEFCQKNTAHSMNPSRYRMDWCFQMSVPTFLHTTVKNSRLQRSLIFSSSSVQETTWLMEPGQSDLVVGNPAHRLGGLEIHDLGGPFQHNHSTILWFHDPMILFLVLYQRLSHILWDFWYTR